MTQSLKSRKKQGGKSEEKSQGSLNESTEAPKVDFKYGPLPKFSGQRIFTRVIIIIGVLTYVWYFSKGGKESILARQNHVYNGRGQSVKCDQEYLDEIKQFPGCIPKKCARMVNDEIVTEGEADVLLWLAKRGMAQAKPKGGATIMDLHSGALTYEDSFLNFYKAADTDFITPTDLMVYKNVRQRIQHAIADAFQLDVSKLHLTYPTFFSKLTSNEPSQIHDEYWHVHVDKNTYGSFHYTSLLYLNDHKKDFMGGRFVYQDNLQNPRENVTVEPRKGRVSFFTSGSENPHFVERVTEGERFAITISFTCDESMKIADPSLKDK